jgi:hypothetical protein
LVYIQWWLGAKFGRSILPPIAPSSSPPT